VIVAVIVPPTARVVTVNVIDVAPAGTVTLAGTDAGSVLDNVTTAPPDGAAAVSVAVPVTELPPMAVGVFSVSDASATPDVTVIAEDRVLPLAEAVIVAEPGATAVTVTAAVDAPAGTVTGDCTVATAVLLLASVTATPPEGAAELSVTVPCTLAPAPIVDALSDRLAIAPPDEGAEGDFEPHAAIPKANINVPAIT